MRFVARVLTSVLLASAFACTMPDPIEKDHSPSTQSLTRSSFYTGNDDYAGDVLTPIVTMAHADGRTVTLIGMIHLADAAFYDSVNAQCATADRVLTEGTRGSPSVGAFMLLTNCVFTMQRRFAYYMAFPSQGDAFENGPQFENGDVTLADWQEWQPWWTPITQTLMAPILLVIFEAANLEFWAGDVLTNLSFTNRAYELQVRDLYARVLSGPDDPDDGDLLLPGIIDHRNDVLLSRVEEEFEDDAVKSIALPWGAGHLRGLIAGLKKRGFSQAELRWQRAWSIKSALEDDPIERPFAFYVPFAVFYKSFREAKTFALALDSIHWNSRASGVWRFELLWDLLYTQGRGSTGESSDFRVGPMFFGRPLLVERVRVQENARWRFLLFGTVGSVGSVGSP